MRPTGRSGRLLALLLGLWGGSSAAAERPIPIEIDVGPVPRHNNPVRFEVPSGILAEGDLRRATRYVPGIDIGGRILPAQFARAWLGRGIECRFVLPRAEAGAKIRARLLLSPPPGRMPSAPSFRFLDVAGDHLDCLLGDLPIHRYMYAYDPGDLQRTYKVYHHVFDRDGKGFITKGPGGTYTHHRGIFFGYRRTVVDGMGYDFWHMKPDGTIQRHAGFVRQADAAGPVFARRVAVIDWILPGGRTAAEERRETVAYVPAPGWRVLQWRIDLASKAGRIVLDGDLQHAGFQFRAPQEVHANQKATRYILPPGSRRLRGDKVLGAPWVACLFAVGGVPYQVAHMSAPENPGRDGAEYSIRAYGRFGEFFRTAIDEGKPLRLRYRILVRSGAPAGSEAQLREGFGRLYDAFARPVEVRVLE